MKRTTTLLLILLWILALFPAGVQAATADNPQVEPLIAGQNTIVGRVEVWDDGTNLYVKYVTDSPWCLMATHLDVETDPSLIPNHNGNPTPGLFEYKATHDCVTSYTYTIPIRSEWSVPPCTVYIAAHAVINGGETAWGGTNDFPGASWAKYIKYTLSTCGNNNCECEPPVTVDFTNPYTPPKLNPGDPVEGMDRVAKGLDINATAGTAVYVKDQYPVMYGAPNGTQQKYNGGLAPGGGFGDKNTRDARQPQNFTFTFASPITNFSLHMLDYGDYNPNKDLSHDVVLTAKSSTGQVVDSEQLHYTQNATVAPDHPRGSDLYGDLRYTGDAVTGARGNPGNWWWSLSGKGIKTVELVFGAGWDPFIAFDTLKFTPECSCCTDPVKKADFTNPYTPPQLNPGDPVEGMDRVVKGLDIQATAPGGEAVYVKGQNPFIYQAPNITGQEIINGGLGATGGFSDQHTRDLKQAQKYTFTFASPITNFSLHMLDFGDSNPTGATSHAVVITAKDSQGQALDSVKLAYTTPAQTSPTSSDSYGNLRQTGDAVSAALGNPGNWTWDLSGNAIKTVELVSGAGWDPFVAFDNLSFSGCIP